MRARATVAYDGTSYSGFQHQVNARSVQDELEEALRKTCNHGVPIVGAGRTDAGVHASGQVVAFEVTWSHSLEELQKALNVRLPEDIRVLDVAICEAAFHPRHSARSRTYEYTIQRGAENHPLLRLYSWNIEQSLNVKTMADAAGLLVGEHDFAAFGSAPRGGVTVRNVLQADWNELKLDCLPGIAGLRFTIEANAFLFHMVRRIVMALVQVGRGQLNVQDIGEILESKDSQRIKGIAPACGLCLVKVTY